MSGRKTKFKWEGDRVKEGGRQNKSGRERRGRATKNEGKLCVCVCEWVLCDGIPKNVCVCMCECCVSGRSIWGHLRMQPLKCRLPNSSQCVWVEYVCVDTCVCVLYAVCCVHKYVWHVVRSVRHEFCLVSFVATSLLAMWIVAAKKCI